MLVNVHSAKTTLSKLLLRAEAGEEIIIARRGKPAVKLVPVGRDSRRTFGRFAGLGIKGDMLAPLEEDELVAWESG